MIEYDEHPSKPSVWREGRFVVLSDAKLASVVRRVAAEPTVRVEGERS